MTLLPPPSHAWYTCNLCPITDSSIHYYCHAWRLILITTLCMLSNRKTPPHHHTHTHANLAATHMHAHLAEPGCLCTKQALGACASKLLENGLGTRRRTSYLLTASGVGTRSPTWTTAVEWKGAVRVICTPAYARYPFTAGCRTCAWGWWEAEKEEWLMFICNASGGTRTHDPWIMSPRPKPLHHQPPPPPPPPPPTHTHTLNGHNLYSSLTRSLIGNPVKGTLFIWSIAIGS